MHELGVTDEEIEHIPHLLVDLHTALIPRRAAVCAGLVRLLPGGHRACWEELSEVLRHSRAMRYEPTADAKLTAARFCAAAMARLEDILWQLISTTILKREAA